MKRELKVPDLELFCRCGHDRAVHRVAPTTNARTNCGFPHCTCPQYEELRDQEVVRVHVDGFGEQEALYSAGYLVGIGDIDGIVLGTPYDFVRLGGMNGIMQGDPNEPRRFGPEGKCWTGVFPGGDGNGSTTA